MIGLDASNVNGEALFRLRLPLVDFAILKATEGLTFVDATLAARAARARAANKLLGFYHFDRSNDDGIAQARFFVATARAQPGETLWLDLETTDAQSWQTVAGRAADFIRTVNALTGAKCGLYSNRSEIVAVIAAADPTQRALIEAAPLWFADPDHAQGRPSCPLPWAIHQFGNLGGLDANVSNPAFVWSAYAVPNAAPTPAPSPTPAPPATGDDDMNPTPIYQNEADGTEIYDFGTGLVHIDPETSTRLIAAGAKVVPVSAGVFAKIPGIVG